jgi:hypothetical protein
LTKTPAPPDRVPEHVVILGLGPSAEAYMDLAKRMGNRRRLCDEVWAINALGDVVQCDRIFHMDDVRIQEIRAAAQPDSNIAAMLEWMRTTATPIYTSRTHPDYPSLVEYPLEAVINDCGLEYLNNTAAAAVAFANLIGVKQITLFGCDYTYANSHDAEKGRACTEFHLGIAKARGTVIGITDRTSLLDGCASRADRLYGYDTLEVELTGGGDGPVKVNFTPRETLPTADEIEARYDHSKHPNPLVGT